MSHADVRRLLYVPLQRPVLDLLNREARDRLLNPRRLAAMIIEQQLTRMTRAGPAGATTPGEAGPPTEIPAVVVEEAPCAS